MTFTEHVTEANRLSVLIDEWPGPQPPDHLIRRFDETVAWLERYTADDFIISDHVVMYRNW